MAPLSVARSSVQSPFDAAVQDLVRYKCSCGSLKPICKLYFCRHCLDIRSEIEHLQCWMRMLCILGADSA